MPGSECQLCSSAQLLALSTLEAAVMPWTVGSLLAVWETRDFCAPTSTHVSIWEMVQHMGNLTSDMTLLPSSKSSGRLLLPWSQHKETSDAQLSAKGWFFPSEPAALEADWKTQPQLIPGWVLNVTPQKPFQNYSLFGNFFLCKSETLKLDLILF